jgi:hypothetical protein
LDEGVLVRDDNHGWHIAKGHVIATPPKVKTPIDLAEEAIRNMVRDGLQK